MHSIKCILAQTLGLQVGRASFSSLPSYVSAGIWSWHCLKVRANCSDGKHRNNSIQTDNKYRIILILSKWHKTLSAATVGLVKGHLVLSSISDCT